MNIDKVTDEIFIIVRKCYNRGTDRLRMNIVQNCVELIVDAVKTEEDAELIFKHLKSARGLD